MAKNQEDTFRELLETITSLKKQVEKLTEENIELHLRLAQLEVKPIVDLEKNCE